MGNICMIRPGSAWNLSVLRGSWFDRRICRCCRKAVRFDRRTCRCCREAVRLDPNMKKAGIRTVLIYDEPEYDAEEFSGYLKTLKKADRNQCVEGIIADIEPFSDGKAKDAAALEEYVSYMKIYGELAHEK